MIYGLGHSTFSADDFIEICKVAGINTIIDTRSHPHSKNHPQYNREVMYSWLPDAGIGYEWWPNLGGWSGRHRDLVEELLPFDVDLDAYVHGHFPKQRIAKKREGGWTNYGFHDYQYYMRLPEFQEEIRKLIQRGQECNVACICCEAYWGYCHRSMIADYLAYLGQDMLHITPRFRKVLIPHVAITTHSHKTLISDRLSRYDAAVLESWEKSRG